MKEFWIQEMKTCQKMYRIKADTLEEAKLHLLEQKDDMDVPEECVDSSTKTVEVNYTQYIDFDHQCCLWYSGDVASVKYGAFTFRICTNGNVCFDGNFDNGQSVRIEDKGNHGTFYNVLHNLIPDDQALANYQYNHPAAFADTNYFEAFVTTDSGKEFTNSFELDSVLLCNAIQEVVENADKYIHWLYVYERPNEPAEKQQLPTKYMVVQNGKTMLIAYSPSQYADMHNFGPLWTGTVFNSKEEAEAVANRLRDHGYEVSKLRAAVFEDIKKQAEAGKSKGWKYGQNYIKNTFGNIIRDLALLKKQIDL